jgi:probable F420-dependent oxidoreductase
MKFGLTFAPYTTTRRSAEEVFRRNVEQIQLAEACGFDAAFISEHHFLDNEMFPSPMIALAFLAAVTSRIRLGTGVLLLPLHDPVRVAEDAALLDRISGGRLIFGIGQGYRPEEFEGYGRRLEDRRGLMREGALLVRRLWTESDVSFHGDHFRVEGLNIRPKPLQRPSPPIWVAGKKRRAIELAAEIGDVWYADPITPMPIIARNQVYWREARRAHGRDPAQPDFAYYREFFVGPDDETAWRVGSPGLLGEYGFYLSVDHLVDDAGRPIPSDREDRLEELVRERCTIGGPARCLDDLARIREMLDPAHLVMKMGHPGIEPEHVTRSIQLAADHVLPAVS